MKYFFILFFPVLLLTTGCQSNVSDTELLQEISPESIQKVISEPFDGITLVNIWATWCAPCIKEFPYLVELQQNYPDDLRVIFISADFPEDREKALEFLREQQVDWPTYLKSGRDLEFIAALSDEWSGSIPFTQYYLPGGVIFTQWSGEADLEQFKSEFLLAIEQI